MTEADRLAYYAWFDEYREMSDLWVYDPDVDLVSMAAWLAACAYCRRRQEEAA